MKIASAKAGVSMQELMERVWAAYSSDVAPAMPEGIPQDQSDLVWRFLDAYNNDPIFKSVVDGILLLRNRK